jgi:hypothetical protein
LEPGLGDRLAPAQRGWTREKYRFVGNKTGEPGVVVRLHRAGEGALGLDYLVPRQFCHDDVWLTTASCNPSGSGV